MSQQRIENQSGDARYFVITPQLVWAKCQDPHDLALWTVIKMIAGDEGECYLDTGDLATLAMMSRGKAHQSRQRLINAGLLKGEIRKDPGYRQGVWHLTIPDLWAENLAWREAHQGLKDRVEYKRQQAASVHQVNGSPGECLEGVERSPGEQKKNHSRRRTNATTASRKAKDELTPAQVKALELLTALPGMDPAQAARTVTSCNLADVAGWVAECRQAPPQVAARLAIARLRDRIPPPAAGTGNGGEQDRRRFISGEFGEFVEH